MTTPTVPCTQCCSPRCAGEGLTYNPTTRTYDVCVAPGGGLAINADGCLVNTGGAGSTVVTGGVGTIVNPVGGGYQVTAPPSAAAGNLITTGPDGLAFISCAQLAATCGVGPVTAGPGVDVTPQPGGGYQVSAAPSTDAGNLLTLGADGNLKITCTEVATCGGGGGPTTVTAGPGVDVTGSPAAGYTVSAPPSTDADNLLTLGADGNVKLNCTAVATCGVGTPTTVTAGPGVDVTGSPAAGYTVSAAPSTDPGNRLTLGADGNLRLTCTDIAGCVAIDGDPATPEVDITGGTGVPGDPYLVGMVPLVTPRARVRSSTVMDVGKRVPGGEPVPMGVVNYDRGGMFDGVSKLVVPAGWAGVYSIGANTQFVGRQTFDETDPGFRASFIRLNFATIIAYEQRTPVHTNRDSTMLNMSTDYELVPGDTLELYVQWDDVDPTTPYTTVPLNAAPEFTAALWATFLHR